MATIFLTTGCVKSDYPVTRQPTRLNKNVHVQTIAEGQLILPVEEPFDANILWPSIPKDVPEPIPGRLLVKISADHTLSSYYRKTENIQNIKNFVPLYRKMPSGLHVIKITELGKGKNGKWQYLIHLEKPQSRKSIRKYLKGTPFSLVPIRHSGTKAELADRGASIVLVEAIKPGIDGVVDIIPRYKYPQLQPESRLNGLFNELKVLSIRRVFRMTEVADASGRIEVQPMTKLLDAAKKKYRLRASRGYPDVDVPPNMENWFLLRLGSKAKMSKVYATLQQHPHIEAISYDYPVKHHAEPNEEPRFAQQKELGPAADFGIEIEPAWAVTDGNSPVKVAVIGTGIQTNLEEFNGRMWINQIEANAIDGQDTDGNGYVDDVNGITTDDAAFEAGTSGDIIPSRDHETKVAAIILAHGTNNSHITGVMGKADVALMNIKIGYAEWGACVEVAEAILYATFNGADIINMSFGVAGAPVLSEAIDAAVSNQGGGVTLIASAGNQKIRATQDYRGHGASCPACFRYVIAVGGSDLNGHLWQSATNPSVGSNYGVHIDLVAPAEDVQTITYSALDQITPDVATLTGTSASAPMVSGVAALLLGKYPATRVERMRLWLRANATDLTDPMNDGSDLIGDDIYTGAGLVNANLSITQGTPDPILVDVRVERISDAWNMNATMRNLVGGSPNIGVQVQGPLADPTGTGPGRWQLDYGLGDDPTTWFPLLVDDAAATNNNMSFTVQYIGDYYGGYLGYTNSIDIGNPLNTDLLANEQVYTIRLSAHDAAGRAYNAYDWFMPVRALLAYPAENHPVTPRWGWPQIDGFADSRPGATFDLKIIKDGQPNSNWMLTGRTHIYEGMNRSTNLGSLVVPEHTGQTSSGKGIQITDYPMFTTGPGGEGSATIELTSHSPSGASTVAVQNIYLDSSSFPQRSGAPMEIATTSPASSIWGNKGIVATSVDAAGTYLIFVQYSKSFLAFDLNGSLVWELTGDNGLWIDQDFSKEDALDGPVFLVDDLDGDGNKEVVVSGARCPLGGCSMNDAGWQVEVHVRKAIDGTAFNANWSTPFTYYYSGVDRNTIKKLHAGDVNGDGQKEIIFYQPAIRSGDHVPETEVPATERGYGKLHVIDVNSAQPFNANWPKSLPLFEAELQVADVKNTGRDKILVAGTMNMYNQQGNLVTGWNPTADLLKGHTRILQFDSDSRLEIITFGASYDYDGNQFNYWMDVVDDTGSRLPGAWPVDLFSSEGLEWYKYPDLVYIQAADIISGGAKEIIMAAGGKVRALNLDGSPVTSFSDIDINGSTHGLRILDVDNDGVEEIVVLVLHVNKPRAYLVPGFLNLYAYEKDGTALAGTDNRWPIRIASTPWWGPKNLGKTVEIVDADGDNKPEVVDLMGILPYQSHNTRVGYNRRGRIDILDLP